MAARKKLDPAKKYMDHFAAYNTKYRAWLKRADKIDERYRDADRQENSSGKRFNILWSNVQTMKPALFSRMPQPDVARRYKDSDPVGRVAANILERALEFEVQHYTDYGSTLGECVLDRLIGGRGTAWVRFEPHFMAAPGQSDDGDQVTEDADESEGGSDEQIEYECAPVDYVNPEDFGHNIARTWEEVSIVWRRAYMTRAALVTRFGKQGEKIPLDTMPEEERAKNKEGGEAEEQYRARILEFWDKEERAVFWIAESDKKLLDSKPDPLGLDGFFPCPKPLYATLTNKSLIPTPDYALYQDQAMQLDLLETRIDGLVDMLKVIGVCSNNTPGLNDLLKSGSNGDLKAVGNWAGFAKKGGLKGSIDILDLTMIVGALKEAVAAHDVCTHKIYVITGISDVIRGQGDPKATATATRMEGQYAGLRLRDMQKSVAEFATAILRLKGEVISKHFSEQTIVQMSGAMEMPASEIYPPEMVEQSEMTGQPLNPEQSYIGPAIQLLKQDPLRAFRIDIAADTLVQLDEDAEKEDTSEFLTSVGGYLANAAKVAQGAPQVVPFLIELLRWAVRRYKIGKTIEGQFDELASAAKKQANQPPPPDLEMMKQQIEQQVRAENAQKEMALAQKGMDLEKKAIQFNADKQVADITAQARDADFAKKQQIHAMTIERDQERTVNKIGEVGRKQNEVTTKTGEEAVETVKALIEQHKEQVTKLLEKDDTATTDALSDKLDAIGRLLSAKKVRKLIYDPKTGKPIGAEETIDG